MKHLLSSLLSRSSRVTLGMRQSIPSFVVTVLRVSSIHTLAPFDFAILRSTIGPRPTNLPRTLLTVPSRVLSKSTAPLVIRIGRFLDLVDCLTPPNARLVVSTLPLSVMTLLRHPLPIALPSVPLSSVPPPLASVLSPLTPVSIVLVNSLSCRCIPVIVSVPVLLRPTPSNGHVVPQILLTLYRQQLVTDPYNLTLRGRTSLRLSLMVIIGRTSFGLTLGAMFILSIIFTHLSPVNPISISLLIQTFLLLRPLQFARTLLLLRTLRFVRPLLLRSTFLGIVQYGIYLNPSGNTIDTQRSRDTSVNTLKSLP